MAASVGVIGSGIAAACCIRRLTAAGMRSTLYEMGRGAGGRLATRREEPDFCVNHGAPAFTARNPEFASLCNYLISQDTLERWEDCQLGVMSLNQAPRSVSLPEGLVLLRGRPTMSHMVRQLLDKAGCEQHFGCFVADLAWDSHTRHWELRGKSEEILGRHEFLVISGSAIAHERWRAVHGTAPPLQQVCNVWGDEHPELKGIISSISRTASRPVVSLLMGFEKGTPGFHWAEERLQYDLANVEDCGSAVGKVVRQRGEWGLSVVVHSTSAFAEQIPAGVHGGRSAIAGFVDSDKEGERHVRDQLWESFLELVGGTPPPGPPRYGPYMHRWGNAFSVSTGQLGDSGGISSPCVPTMGLALCGDYVAPVSSDTCHVEVAALSGMDAAEKIIRLDQW